MGTKVTVVGGGSTYTPELIDGFMRRRDRLAIDELVLLDIDTERLEIVGGLAQRMLDLQDWTGRLVRTTDPHAAIDAQQPARSAPHGQASANAGIGDVGGGESVYVHAVSMPQCSPWHPRLARAQRQSAVCRYPASRSISSPLSSLSASCGDASSGSEPSAPA